MSLQTRSNSRRSRCSSFASAENPPCFQFALLERANPLAVRGPELVPPCIRHRPFGIAGALHGDPRRVFAPHLGDLLKSPQGLPFLSHPLRGAWVSFSATLIVALPLVASRPLKYSSITQSSVTAILPSQSREALMRLSIAATKSSSRPVDSTTLQILPPSSEAANSTVAQSKSESSSSERRYLERISSRSRSM